MCHCDGAVERINALEGEVRRLARLCDEREEQLEQKQEMIDSLQSQVFDLKEQLRAADHVAKEVGKARDTIVEKYNRMTEPKKRSDPDAILETLME